MNIRNKNIFTTFETIINIFIIFSMSSVWHKFDYIGLGFLNKIGLLTFMIYIYSIILSCLFIKKIKLYKIKENSNLIILWIAIFIISLIVSNNKTSMIVECIQLLLCLVYSIYLINRFNMNDLVEIIYKSQLLIMITTITFFTMFPSLSYEPYGSKLVLCASFPSKNNLATQLAFGLLISIIYFIENTNKAYVKKITTTIVIIIQMILLIMANSLTSILTVIISILILLMYKTKIIKINLVNILIFVYIILYYTVFSIMNKNGVVPVLFGRDFTLTGRVYLWDSIISNILKGNYMLGYGYGTFWGGGLDIESNIILGYISKLKVIVSGSHNLFIELLLQIGIIGTLIFIFLLIRSGYKAKKIKDCIVKDLFIIYMSYFLIYGLTERSFWALHFQTLMLFTAIGLVNKEYYQIKNKGDR